MSKRVLIADDTAYMRAIIKDTLQKASYTVVGEAEDGEDAITLYRQHQPDVVIMNIVMPKINGLQALQCIKEWDPSARIILCSAMGQAPAIFSAIKAGACDFLVKPFEPQGLLECLNRTLNPQPPQYEETG